MDWLKFVPFLFQLIEWGTSIRQAVRNGESVLDLLKTKAPSLIDLIASIGKSMFPTLASPADQVQAGALTIDPSLVMTVQAGINKLGASPALIVDGAYGAKTKAAVMAFQTAHPPLVADGWAGKLTQSAIQAELAKLPA